MKNNIALVARCRWLASSFVAVVLMLASLPVEAGRRPFIWVWDTEVIEERAVEIEQWVWEVGKPNKAATWVWWAPVIGLTDSLELALPIESHWWWAKKPDGKVVDATRLESWGMSLRWRLSPSHSAPAADKGEASDDFGLGGSEAVTETTDSGSWPVDSLIRLAVKRPNSGKQVWQVEGNLVFSKDMGQLHAALDLGAVFVSHRRKGTGYTEGKFVDATYAAGLAYGITDSLRLGAEVFGVVGVYPKDDSRSFTMAGPDIGFTHGRTWLTLGALIGVTENAADWMPRLIWAIKF